MPIDIEVLETMEEISKKMSFFYKLTSNERQTVINDATILLLKKINDGKVSPTKKTYYPYALITLKNCLYNTLNKKMKEKTRLTFIPEYFTAIPTDGDSMVLEEPVVTLDDLLNKLPDDVKAFFELKKQKKSIREIHDQIGFTKLKQIAAIAVLQELINIELQQDFNTEYKTIIYNKFFEDMCEHISTAYYNNPHTLEMKSKNIRVMKNKRSTRYKQMVESETPEQKQERLLKLREYNRNRKNQKNETI